MVNLEPIRDIVKNKNFVMFAASIIFMLGISSCFCQFAVSIAGMAAIFMIILMYLRLFSIKKIFAFTLIFYCGFFLTFFKIKNYDELLIMVPVKTTLTGTIASVPAEVNKTKAKFFVEVEKAGDKQVKAKTFVTISGDEKVIDELNIGEKIQISGRLRRPFYASNPSQFDYSAYLRNFNTFTTMYSKTNDIKILSDELTLRWKFLQVLNNTRNRILSVHAKYLKSPNLEILGGIVFGDDAVSTPDYIKNSFINSGLLHVLAASGMNVAFIYTFWLYILKFLKVPFKMCIFSGMPVVILYTFMTGLGASVIRAALMLLFVLAGKLIDRDAHSVSLLAFVAVLMLIYNPAYINDVSFQLSFVVTFGLLTTGNILIQKLDKIPDGIKIIVIIPLAAQLWAAPIQMFYFNTFSLYSVFSNISTVNLLSFISFGGFVSSAVSIFAPAADITCKVFDFFLNYLLNLLVFISDFFANIKYCLVQTAHPGIIQILLYYFMILSATYLVKFSKYKQACFTVLGVSLVLLITTLKPVSHNLEIIAFDVQNADSFLLKTPANKYFMIDTGKAPYDSGNSQAKIIMLKYLKDRGIKNLEGVIVTHFDNDHSGGTCDIISNTKTKTLYLNTANAQTQTAVNIFNTVRQIGQKYVIAENNKEIYKEPDLSIKTFKADIKGQNASNESSVITLVSYKDFDMLFMGDAGIDAFNKVKKYIARSVEVLKVGHHGGAHAVDSSMAEYLGNRVSLISTGINYFGHPHNKTLAVLANTEILRTDLLHSIKISTDGRIYSIYSYDTHDKNYKLRKKFEAE